MRWPTGSIRIDMALDNAPRGVSASDAAAAAQRAIATYTDALEPMQAAVHVDLRARTSKAGVDPGDGVSTIIWVDDAWADDYDPTALAVTVTTYDSASGRIEDADIVVNGGNPW